MADMAQVVVTSAMGIAGVVIGVGLTYWLGALNRRHQETREDRTRWYETRLQAYVDLSRAVTNIIALSYRPGHPTFEAYEEATLKLVGAVNTIRLVGSKEVAEAADHVYDVALEKGMADLPPDRQLDTEIIRDAITAFRAAARKDLGHPSL